MICTNKINVIELFFITRIYCSRKQRAIFERATNRHWFENDFESQIEFGQEAETTARNYRGLVSFRLSTLERDRIPSRPPYERDSCIPRLLNPLSTPSPTFSSAIHRHRHRNSLTRNRPLMYESCSNRNLFGVVTRRTWNLGVWYLSFLRYSARTRPGLRGTLTSVVRLRRYITESAVSCEGCTLTRVSRPTLRR